MSPHPTSPIPPLQLPDPLDRPESGSAPDPEQLPLGMFEGIPMLPVEIYGPDDEVVIIPVREPPVCGEWSYDDSELEEPKFVAKRIDGVAAPTSRATPIHPIRAQIDPRPTVRQHPTGGNVAAGVLPAGPRRVGGGSASPGARFSIGRCPPIPHLPFHLCSCPIP